jgi:hypothetical protein
MRLLSSARTLPRDRELRDAVAPRLDRLAQSDSIASSYRAQDRWETAWRPIALSVLGVLTAAAAYEAAVALGWLAVGPEPGQAPFGNGLVLGAAVVALIAGAGVCVVYASRSRQPAEVLGSLIAPTAVTFVVARFYAFDPYYAPSLRRMSDDGLVPASWVYALVGLALLAAILTRIRPRIGLTATALMLLLSAFTALAEGGGH